MDYKQMLKKMLRGYAFDIDNNLRTLTTKIFLENNDGIWEEVSTEQFAIIRSNPRSFNFKENINYDRSFVNFRKEKDDLFLIEIMQSERASSWNDFVECVNCASIFSWITARGHQRSTFKKAFRMMLKSNFDGLDFDSFLKHQRYYMDFIGIDNSNMSNDDILDYYIDLCRFYGMEDEESSMEVLGIKECHDPGLFKPKAFSMFCDHLESEFEKIISKADKDSKTILVKQGMHVGISDDDQKTVNVFITSLFARERVEKNLTIHVYDTSNGKRKVV